MSTAPTDHGSGGGQSGGVNGDAITHRPRRPLPALVAGYGIGILLGILYHAPFALLLGAGMAAAILTMTPMGRWPMAHIAVLLLGWATVLHRLDGIDTHAWAERPTKQSRYVAVEGVVRSPPVMMERDNAGRPVYRFELDIDSRRNGTAWEAVSAARVLASMAIPEPGVLPRYGDRWRVNGALRIDDRPATRMRGWVGYLDVRGASAERLAEGQAHALAAWAYDMRERAAERLGIGVPEDSRALALVRALLLGYRQDIPVSVHEAFARTGTLHVLALSGMHVGMLVLLFTVLLKSSGVSRPCWVLFLVPFLAFYTVGTGAAASTVRASIMTGAFFSAALFRRKADSANALALAALAILAVDPLALFDLGFILSFTVVAGLIGLYPVLRSLLAPERGEADSADPEAGWLAAGRSWRRRMAEMFGISIAAWLASLPLIATHFHLISPIALLVNLPLLPLAAVILFTACLSTLSGFLGSGATALFNAANEFFGETLIRLVEWTSAIPFGFRYVEAWSGCAVAGWYAALILFVLGKGSRRSVVPALVMVAMTVWSLSERTLSRRVRAAVIPSGSSCLLLVDGPGDHAVLVDSGSAYSARSLVNTLRSLGIGRLDEVVLSRATSDAYGGLTTLMDFMEVGRIRAPEPATRQPAFLARRDEWSSRTSVSSWPTEPLEPCGAAWNMDFLYPEPGARYRSALDSALMIRVGVGHESILFMGGSGRRLEDQASTRRIDWNAGTLVVGRCDTPDALGSDWLSLTSPDRLVYSSRAFNRLPVGGQELHRRLAARSGTELTDLGTMREPVFIDL